VTFSAVSSCVPTPTARAWRALAKVGPGPGCAPVVLALMLACVHRRAGSYRIRIKVSDRIPAAAGPSD